MAATEGTRRTANVHVRGRAADVVARVLSATADELGRVGYAAFRVEDVATRSGVNKTTIYRRWPTKPELIADAINRYIDELVQRAVSIFDTGTLHGDLRASLLPHIDLTPSQMGMLRAVTERSAPELDAITKRAREELQRMRLAIVHRAIARGELPKGIDAHLIVDLVSSPVQKALLFNERLSANYVDRVIDVVLAGVVATGSPSKRSTRSKKPTRRAP